MKVAVVGKGGVGKTFIAGALSRLIREGGYEVIAIDADPSMNLYLELGVKPEVFKKVIPLCENKALIKERTKVGGLDENYPVFNLNPYVADIVEGYAVETPEGIKLLILGTVTGAAKGCMCPANALLRALLRHVFRRVEATVIVDMEAGLEHLGRGTIEYVDVVLNILEPSIQSVETSLRIRSLVEELGVKKHLFIANKISNQEQEKFISDELSRHGFSLDLKIPYDERVRLSGLRPAGLTASLPPIELVAELKRRLYE
ncbi:AAA family ATPase [Candidatus Bathyarchaeota archaeon]|nr:AAA family ATPase [Candidatus Bathyarchaeota archaeon]MBS7629564.1 AAA family ATPase [Candidatus Bathyarchaeota archaeon]